MLSLYNRNAILLVCIPTFTRHASSKRFVLAAGVVRSELDKHGHGNFLAPENYASHAAFSGIVIKAQAAIIKIKARPLEAG
jgi:hypothetical protein